MSPASHFFFKRKAKQQNKINLFIVVVKKHFGQTFSPASFFWCVFKNLDSHRHKVSFLHAMYAMYAMYATTHLSHAINATLHTLHATNAIFNKREKIQQIWTLTVFIEGGSVRAPQCKPPRSICHILLVHHLRRDHHKAMENYGGVLIGHPHFQGIWLVSLHAMYVMYLMLHLLHATNVMSHTLHATNAMNAMNRINARKSDVV
jgi:hypothetical protein